jgi:hypothetical protein
MNLDEYNEYLRDYKANLTEKQRIRLTKEYNKLPKSLKYWSKRRNNCIGCSDEEYLFQQYCDKKISYINQRQEELEYILDI